MTNLEKFKEVFKGNPNKETCPIYCATKEDCPYRYTNCWAGDWWNMEYKTESEEE